MLKYVAVCSQKWLVMFLVLLAACLFVFPHILHVYLIHINRACIKANNLNRVSTHPNIALEMKAPARRAAFAAVISFVFRIYSFVCLSLSLELGVHVVCHLFTSRLLLVPLPASVVEEEVFAQRIRAGRIPSLWYVMNILQHCYVIYAQGLELKAPTLHPLTAGSCTRSALINWVFLLLYKQEPWTPERELISGWLLMILKTDWV